MPRLFTVFDDVDYREMIRGFQYKSGSEVKTYQVVDVIANEWEAVGRELRVEEEFLKNLSAHGQWRI